MSSWSLLGRFKKAVKKIKILLKFDNDRLRLIASMFGATSRKNLHHRLSFDEGRGLRNCVDDSESEYYSIISSPSIKLHRTISNQSDDDIDKKAELFIEKFRRQLRIERQISLELKYCQGNNSFKLASP